MMYETKDVGRQFHLLLSNNRLNLNRLGPLNKEKLSLNIVRNI